MIVRLTWHHGINDKNPFLDDNPLKITFHNSSFINLSSEDQKAIDTLYELALSPQIQPLETDVGNFPYVQIKDYNVSTSGFPIRVDYPSGKSITTTAHLPYDSKRLIESFQEDEVSTENQNIILNLDC